MTIPGVLQDTRGKKEMLLFVLSPHPFITMELKYLPKIPLDMSILVSVQVFKSKRN